MIYCIIREKTKGIQRTSKVGLLKKIIMQLCGNTDEITEEHLVQWSFTMVSKKQSQHGVRIKNQHAHYSLRGKKQ